MTTSAYYESVKRVVPTLINPVRASIDAPLFVELNDAKKKKKSDE